MEQLGRIYSAIVSDEIAFFFCALIIAWLVSATVIALIQRWAETQTGSKLVAMTPNSLTTLGVLGTFTGILIGLLDFDVDKVDDSVPQLLAGLKIAFTTSIVGISAAVAFRLLRAITPSSSSIEGVGPDEIHSALLEIRDDGRSAAIRSAEQLASLRSAISSDGDGSLLTQMQKLRATVQDGQNALIQEFRQFAQHMTENNQKAIIQALEQVIRDFNTNLTEQLGDNFKQLNEAVHSLVSWQDNYREHVEALERRLDMAVRAVESSQAALRQVEEHASKIPGAIEQLEPALIGMNAQAQAMKAHLDALAQLRDKAIEAFPIVEANLEKITSQLGSSVESAVQASRDAIEHSEKELAALSEGYRELLRDSESSRENFSAELSNALRQMNEATLQEFSKHGHLIEAAAEEAQKAMSEAWVKSSEKIDQQFETFDHQMQQELTRSLELLGRNLASVSEKFVSDYTPLTRRLRELLQVSQGVS